MTEGMISAMKRLLAAAILLLVASAPSASQQSAVDAIKIKPEQTNFEETSRYDDVVGFLNELVKAAPRLIRIKSFGTTHEGRSLPLAVVGASTCRPKSFDAAEKFASTSGEHPRRGGRGEGIDADAAARPGGRAARGMARQDGLPGRTDLQRRRQRGIALNNRGPQHGPMGGQGTRANAQGLNINRDHHEARFPRSPGVRPDDERLRSAGADGAPTNGTRRVQRLVSPPLNPATDNTVIRLAPQSGGSHG